MKKDAVISPDRKYRYVLTRDWHPASAGRPTPLVFVMLNPSVADADIDDPTVRRCVGFADRAGCDAIAILNLFALRSAKPKPPSKWTRGDIGPDQDFALWLPRMDGLKVVCAWGAGAPEWRVAEVAKDLAGRDLWCLGTTALGAPRHPLYVPNSQGLEKWEP